MAGVLRILALFALLAGATALAACGDDSSREEKNAYVREINAAQREFARRVTAVSRQITPESTPAQDRRTLQRFKAAIDTVVARLRAIDVPPDVEAEHEQLVVAMSGFGTEIAKANTALRNPDTRSIAEAQRAVTAATQTVNGQIDAAIAAINSKLRDT